MKKIIVLVGLILSNVGLSQTHIPKIPKSSLYKSRYLQDSTECRITDFGRWIFMCDSCTLYPEYKEFDRAFYRLEAGGYEEAVDVIQELNSIIEFYKVKLDLPNDVSYFNPTEISGENYFILMDKDYYTSHNKVFTDKKTYSAVAPKSVAYARYDLIPNRLTIHFMFSGLASEFIVVDSNQFK